MAKRRKKKNENKLFPLGVVAREDIENPGMANRIRAEATEFFRIHDELMVKGDHEKAAAGTRAELAGNPEWEAASEEERRLWIERELSQAASEACWVAASKQPDKFPLMSAIHAGRIPGLGDIFDFVISGENTLRLYPDLAAALVRTKVRAPREVFKMPYPVIEILPPREMIRGWRVSAEKKILPVPVFAIWLTQKRGILRLFLHGGSPDGSDLQGTGRLDISLARLLSGDGMFDEKAIRDAVVADTNAMRLTRGDSRWEALRLAINAVLYMSSVEADVQPTPQTREADEREKRDYPGTDVPEGELPPRPPCRPRALNIGRKVRLPGIRGGGGGDGSGPKIRHQFWVRGHWRNQRLGPGRSQTELRWIQPFIKGRGRGLPVLYKRDYEAEGA